jgi:hypothetical protein
MTSTATSRRPFHRDYVALTVSEVATDRAEIWVRSGHWTKPLAR